MDEIKLQLNDFLEREVKNTLQLKKIEVNFLPNEYYELYKFETITSLFFRNCDIDYIDERLKKFKNVKSLMISDTTIENIDEIISFFPKLESLSIGNSNVIEFPDSILKLEHLKTLTLTNIVFNNMFDEITAILGLPN